MKGKNKFENGHHPSNSDYLIYYILLKVSLLIICDDFLHVLKNLMHLFIAHSFIF